MAILEFQTQIDAPSEAVFSYVSDLEKHVDWSGGQAIRKTSEGPIAAGSTYETQEQGPFGMTLKEKSEVIVYEAGERFAWRSYGPIGTWFDWSFEVRYRGGETILVERLEGSHGLLATVMLNLFVRRQLREAMPQGLAQIKERIEAG